MLSNQQIKLISLWLQIQKFNWLYNNTKEKETWARSLYLTKIHSLESDYFDLWIELNRETLTDKFIIEQTEDWVSIDIVEQQLETWSVFVDWCMSVCFEKF